MLITYNKFSNFSYIYNKFQTKKAFLNHFIRINNVSQVWAWSDLTIDNSIMLLVTKITLYVIHRSIVKSVAITP